MSEDGAGGHLDGGHQTGSSLNKKMRKLEGEEHRLRSHVGI
jgi:hypothetical protein